MATEDQVYRDLQRHLDGLPIGFPVTESGVEIRVLKHLFTPKEAHVATRLSMFPEPLERIHKRVGKAGMSVSELEQVLDGMASRGTIVRTIKDDKKHYQSLILAVGMYEMQVGRLTKEFAFDMEQYLNEAFGKELLRSKTPQLRTIPVQQSIPGTRFVSTYDDLRQTVEDADGRIVVNECICRKGKDLMGEICSKTDLRESCFAFGDMADFVSELGMGRAVGRDEALDILGQAAEAGLVIQPANWQKPSFVCTCCGDCCGVLTTLKKLPRPAEYWATNHYAEVNAETCTACEMCVDRCQMEALTLTNGTATINLDLCIGCGNCVASCPDEAIELRRRSQQLVPPETMMALYQGVLAEKIGMWNMLKIGAKKAVGMKV